MNQHEGGFEFFAVTADTGIRAWGPDLPAVFRQAARALWSLLVESTSVEPRKTVGVSVGAGERDALLVAWLNELLYLYETQGLIGTDCAIRSMTDMGLSAEVWGEAVDRARHTIVSHVKAATYHQLHVGRTASGWEARVVVDV
jgi:SHS2 domain-containing protein